MVGLRVDIAGNPTVVTASQIGASRDLAETRTGREPIGPKLSLHNANGMKPRVR